MENNYKKILILSIIFFIVLILSMIYGKYSFHNYGPFTNKISLPQKFNIDVNSDIDIIHFLSDKSELIAVSLDDKKIFFVDLNEGKVIKTINIEKKFKQVRIESNDQMAYFIYDDDYLYVLDLEKIELKNIFHDKKGRYFNSEVFLYNNYLITSDNSWKISVINLNNGSINAYENWVRLKGIQLYDGILYYWESGNNIYAVSPSTLNSIWERVESHGDGHFSANIVINDNKVFFNNYERTKVLNAKTGEIVTEYPLSFSSYFIADNYLYTINVNSGKVSCVDASNGKVIWKKVFNSSSNIRIIKENLFTLDFKNKTMKKVNRFNGKALWETKWGSYIGKAFETNQYDIIQDDYWLIYVINKDTGEKLWRYPQQLNEVKWNIYQHYLVIADGSKIIAYDLE